MARIRVALEDGLHPFREYLLRAGYQVVSMEAGADADVFVVSGLDSNLLGQRDTVTAAPVINADGLTPEQVVAAVATRTSR